MKTVFRPVMLYFEGSSQSFGEFIDQSRSFIEPMGDIIDVGHIETELPKEILSNEIVLLTANYPGSIIGIIQKGELNPDKVILMGEEFSEAPFGLLEATQIAGLVRLNALESWHDFKVRPHKKPHIHSIRDYGMLGRKEAFNPTLFSGEFFDTYQREKYGYFEPINPDDRLNLELNLLNFATEWLLFLNGCG